MYLHIGGETVVSTDRIVGVFDLDNTTTHKSDRRFINEAQKSGEIIDGVPGEIPRTFVITEENGVQTVYLTSINSKTLKKRMDTRSWLADEI